MVLFKIENILNRIPFFKDNTLQGNILAILAAFTYIVIMVDLQTPMAIEKNEIFSVVELLEDSIDSTQLDDPVIQNIDFQFLGITPVTSAYIINNDYFSCLKDRAPPCLI